MANFNIIVLGLPLEPYENDPAIAFFNSFRGEYTGFEDSELLSLKKINSEVLLRDIIRNNNAIILNSNDVKVMNGTSSNKITAATIVNPNILSHVTFAIKESFFENGSTNGPATNLPADLLQIGSSLASLVNLDMTPTVPVTEYPINQLNNLYLKNYTPDDFFPNAIRGYVELYYNFRKSDGTYDTNMEAWSILRIQFGFAENTGGITKPYIFNQINLIPQSDFNNEFSNTGCYPVELYKGTDKYGNLIPIYYHGTNNIEDLNAAIEIATRTHSSGYSSDPTVLTLDIDNGTHELNRLEAVTGYRISSISSDTGLNFDMIDVFKYEGTTTFASNGRWESTNIIGIIEDVKYIPLI